MGCWCSWYMKVGFSLPWCLYLGLVWADAFIVLINSNCYQSTFAFNQLYHRVFLSDSMSLAGLGHFVYKPYLKTTLCCALTTSKIECTLKLPFGCVLIRYTFSGTQLLLGATLMIGLLYIRHGHSFVKLRNHWHRINESSARILHEPPSQARTKAWEAKSLVWTHDTYELEHRWLRQRPYVKVQIP